MQHEHVVAAGHGERAVRHVVVGVVDRQRFEMLHAARKIHRAAQQQLELRREVHVRVDRRAVVEAKVQRLRPAVLAGQQHLAGERDALGGAALPRRVGRIDDVALLHAAHFM